MTSRWEECGACLLSGRCVVFFLGECWTEVEEGPTQGHQWWHQGEWDVKFFGIVEAVVSFSFYCWPVAEQISSGGNGMMLLCVSWVWRLLVLRKMCCLSPWMLTSSRTDHRWQHWQCSKVSGVWRLLVLWSMLCLVSFMLTSSRTDLFMGASAVLSRWAECPSLHGVCMLFCNSIFTLDSCCLLKWYLQLFNLLHSVGMFYRNNKNWSWPVDVIFSLK